MKRKLKKVLTTIKNITSFPVFWVAISIFVLSVISLFVSLAYESIGKTYESSMYNNVFTGLLTGLVLSILSGVKSVYAAYMEARLNWLEETHKMILDHLNEERKLWSAQNETDEIFFNVAYDTASKANWVNDRITQSTFEKVKWFEPQKYFKKHYNYDCFEANKIMSDMHDFLRYECNEPMDRKTVKAKIKNLSNLLMSLNRNILSDMDSIKVKLASTKKSII
mgnify:CR=1 FL=1|jgi:hypothetical protein